MSNNYEQRKTKNYEEKERNSFTNDHIKPGYYHDKGLDVFAYMEMVYPLDYSRGFYIGNIHKYIRRYNKKNGVEDLVKARTYLDQLIELEKKVNDENVERATFLY